ncbi:uncharacterized protein PFL1_02190 [Pseudozyma flocculosa PF-1]|uniref:Secreted protein n=1 Tax=Pseudozyma flocculosa TaxID=84751 RepID=A0A5C3FCR0_9BASI|nr:uncharacterized protein PFL1_02190 [Pseudozyma flocculosa PF-1]EPQ30073.1 hypothetical protein PFL1_02190 [Pseudozyma flocculosa PF-1]SPO41417.1 uncharacterized protein PSFLO_06899 [Pseudozyma flocculosa]
MTPSTFVRLVPALALALLAGQATHAQAQGPHAWTPISNGAGILSIDYQQNQVMLCATQRFHLAINNAGHDSANVWCTNGAPPCRFTTDCTGHGCVFNSANFVDVDGRHKYCTYANVGHATYYSPTPDPRGATIFDVIKGAGGGTSWGVVVGNNFQFQNYNANFHFS